MAPPVLSYTQTVHNATYPAINPNLPSLSTAGKVVVITGASGGIGRATSSSFAASGPKALVLLGRRSDALQETADLVNEKFPDVQVQTHSVDLLDAATTREILKAVVANFGYIDVLVHAAGILAPVVPLLEADPATFLDGYKTTIVGTLVIAQAAVLANETLPKTSSDDSKPELTFVHLTTAGIFFPPFHGMGAYTSSKLAAVKLLQAFAAENSHVRLHHVHPGFLRTAMSAQLAKTTKLPFEYDDISLPADFLVWIASSEARFLHNKVVFASWDVEELKASSQRVVGVAQAPGSGELEPAFKGFPRYINGQALSGATGN